MLLCEMMLTQKNKKKNEKIKKENEIDEEIGMGVRYHI